MNIKKIEFYIHIDKDLDSFMKILENMNFQKSDEGYQIQYRGILLEIKNSHYTKKDKDVYLIRFSHVENLTINYQLYEFLKQAFMKRILEHMLIDIIETNVTFSIDKSAEQIINILRRNKFRKPYENVNTVTLTDYKRKNEIVFVIQEEISEAQLFISNKNSIHYNDTDRYVKRLLQLL